MNIYFDCKFTNFERNSDLISLGLITENGDKFYAEFIDYNREFLTQKVKDEVISNLWATSKGYDAFNESDYFVIGTKKEITSKLEEFLSNILKDYEITFVTNSCKKKFSSLIDLLWSIPNFIHHNIRMINFVEDQNLNDMYPKNALDFAETIRSIYKK